MYEYFLLVSTSPAPSRRMRSVAEGFTFSMDLLNGVVSYIADNPDRFRGAVEVHLRLSGTTLLWALLMYLPLGVLISRSRKLGPSIVAVIAAFRVVPSLAIVFLAFPILGIGFRPALFALILLAGPPLVINTDAGLRNVPAAVIENARGLGMNPFQIFFRVEVPLASPVIVAGIRTATVEIIASAAIAAFIGVRSLGQFITSGLTLNNNTLLLVGAIPVATLALLAEWLLGATERRLTPPTA